MPTIQPTSNPSITILVDNRADLIVKSTDTIKYFTEKPLLAEHGFAALIDLPQSGIRILWDAGITPFALLENMKRMKVEAGTIHKIALSHGHSDHTAGITDVLKQIDPLPKAKEWGPETTLEEIHAWMEGWRLPLIAHPAAFRERWGVAEDGTWYGPFYPPPRQEWEAAGAEVILAEGPFELAPGCWTTGAIPRRSYEKSGIPISGRFRQGNTLLKDEIDEDQAVLIHVKDKGLVVLSGCAHSGIINTIEHARQISGVERIWAILGGFHLATASDEDIQQTINQIKVYEPELIVPSHCTGFKAICQFAVQMPEACIPGVVGAKYLF